ncbi:TolC family protein [Enterobacteriaceae bacterium H11S18]|uniref:TolC family protein n=1 Tax=Dryocola clanedunensis TaxID=2925396 RepID=UPI0022F10C49|nr:TolC family protein [Dryocola clanedunensis]MCT4711317.1 TolC family protein [Dryocola clanedunensis]
MDNQYYYKFIFLNLLLITGASQSLSAHAETPLPDAQSVFSGSTYYSASDMETGAEDGIPPLATHRASQQSIKSYLAQMALAAKNYTPQIREAKTSFQAASADTAQAKGARLPQVDVGLQSNPVQFGSGEEVPRDQLTNGLSVNMTTPVFDWGYNSRNINSKELTAKAAENYYRAQYENTSYQVCYQLAELAKQKLIFQISQAYVDRMERLVRMIGDISRVDAGRVGELTQAQARMLQAETSRDDAESKIKDAQIALRKLTGKTSFIGLPTDPEWAINIENPQKLLKAINRHPTIQQARNEAKSALEQAKAVKSGNLPKLSWVVSKTVPINSGAYEEEWKTYLNVSWGIFRGGSANAQEEAAALRAEQAKEKITEQQIDLDNKVRSSLHNMQSMLSQAAQYHRLVQATDQVRKDFFEQWRQLSTRTLLDVLTAESDYYNNQVSEVTTRFNAYSAMFTGYANAGLLNQWLGVYDSAS